MSDFDKIAVIGDADLVFAWRALGLHVFSPRDAEAARRIRAEIGKGNFALCFVHQKWLEIFQEEEKDSGRKFWPVVVGFSDFRSLTDEVEKKVRGIAAKATGSDSLVKRKGKDEST
jgi:V/A-type H+-transporting ATPase subunit F